MEHQTEFLAVLPTTQVTAQVVLEAFDLVFALAGPDFAATWDQTRRYLAQGRWGYAALAPQGLLLYAAREPSKALTPQIAGLHAALRRAVHVCETLTRQERIQK